MDDETNVPVEAPAVTEKPKRKPRKDKGTMRKPVKKPKAKSPKRKAKAAASENGDTKEPKKALPVTRWTVPDDKKLTVLIDHNPKSPKSPSAMRFELYRKAETVGDYRKFMRLGRAGGKAHFANLDLARDKARGYIKF